VTDSAADLSQELVNRFGIQVVPLRFTFGEETFEDHPDRRAMTIEEFYARLRRGEKATTSAINVGDYRDALTPLLREGKDILILAFTSGLSTTYQSAVIAAQELREEFHQRSILVVDTLCASMGEGLLVWYAARMKEEGRSMEEIQNWVEENKLHLCHWVAVDDLDHLKRGGRISAASAFVGGMLAIKPIIHVDNEGKLINVGKVRGRTASLRHIADKTLELAQPKQGQTIFISHSDCPEDAKFVGDHLREAGLAEQVVYNHIGPVIGAHTGPGTVAVFCLGVER
jgi:DegV family protein with EDD domain